jgi:hypothetical protein
MKLVRGARAGLLEQLMMSNLKEFLKRQAEEQRATADERDAVRREWLDSLDRLMGQLERWLRETDTEGTLKIEPMTHRLKERRVGIYDASGLRISLSTPSLGTPEIRLEPIARHTSASSIAAAVGGSIEGRVDLTNDEMKYFLYRIKKNGKDEWVMVDDREYRPEPLERDNFEAAIQSMLE